MQQRLRFSHHKHNDPKCSPTFSNLKLSQITCNHPHLSHADFTFTHMQLLLLCPRPTYMSGSLILRQQKLVSAFLDVFTKCFSHSLAARLVSEELPELRAELVAAACICRSCVHCPSLVGGQRTEVDILGLGQILKKILRSFTGNNQQ